MRTRGGEWIKVPVQQTPRAEPELQPHAEGRVQGGGHHGDQSRRGQTAVPALCEAARWWDETEPGNCASDRFHSALALAQRRGVRPKEARDDGGVNRRLIGAAASDADNARSAGSETQRLKAQDAE